MTIAAGSKVQVHGLQSEEGQKLNGMEGVVDHFSNHRQRHAVKIPGVDDLKMIKDANLKVLESGGGSTAKTTDGKDVFMDEAALLEQLKLMGMPEQMLQNLTKEQKATMFTMSKRQDILQRAKKLAGVDDNEDDKKNFQDCGHYQWKDAVDHIFIKIPNASNCTAENIDCQISASTLSVAIQGTNVLKGNFFQEVLPMVSKGELMEDNSVFGIKLQKVKPMRWLMALR